MQSIAGSAPGNYCELPIHHYYLTKPEPIDLYLMISRVIADTFSTRFRIMSPCSTNPYAEVHADPKGAGDIRPTSVQIIHDEGLINAMTGKVMLVTGSTSGIGVDTVRALHLTGADVYMQARDLKKAEAVRDDIIKTSEGKGKLDIVLMDLNSFKSIREGVRLFLSKTPNSTFSSTMRVCFNVHCRTKFQQRANFPM